MKLTFHGHVTAARGEGHPALLSFRRKDGSISLNSIGVKRHKQENGGKVTLVSDEQGTWYILFGEAPGATPFLWRRQGGGNGTNALQFFSQPRATECLAAHKIAATTPRVYFELAGGPEHHEGFELYRLIPTNLKPATPRRTTAPIPFVPVLEEPRPDEATLFRLTELVRTLGGMLLHKREEAELTRALGLLQANRKWLPTIPGTEKLLGKLEAHFTA